MNRMGKKALAGAFAGILVLAPAACGDDEDGDGGTTDEELQDAEDTAEDVGNEAEELGEDVENEAEDLGNQAEEEVDAQDEGSNEDGE